MVYIFTIVQIFTIFTIHFELLIHNHEGLLQAEKV